MKRIDLVARLYRILTQIEDDFDDVGYFNDHLDEIEDAIETYRSNPQ